MDRLALRKRKQRVSETVCVVLQYVSPLCVHARTCVIHVCTCLNVSHICSPAMSLHPASYVCVYIHRCLTNKGTLLSVLLMCWLSTAKHHRSPSPCYRHRSERYSLFLCFNDAVSVFLYLSPISTAVHTHIVKGSMKNKRYTVGILHCY